MGRPAGLTPGSIDQYCLHQVSGADWRAIHACTVAQRAGTRYYESVCGMFTRPDSALAEDLTYDTVSAALAADANPCAVCAETGAFGEDFA